MRFSVPLLAAALLTVSAAAAPADAGLSVAGIGQVNLYRPATPPRGLVLFLSGDGGWNLGVVDMARILAKQGVTVAGISVPAYLKAAESSPTPCVDLAGDLQRAARAVEAAERLPRRAPIVVGYSSGATMAYAALLQGGPGAFRGGLSLGFGPDQTGVKPWCRGAMLSARRITAPEHGWWFEAAPRLGAPWLVLQGLTDQVVSPAVTRAFTAKIADATLIELPGVGHGFSVPRNWEPQFSRAFAAILAPPPAVVLAPQAPAPDR